MNIIGTYECVIDSKGRISVPSALRKQLEGVLSDGFVLKRSVFQSCLELHPMNEWDKTMTQINSLNRFVKKNNDFIRQFTAGLKLVELDASGRFQVAKDLVSFSGLTKNIVLSSSANMIEVWDKDAYEKVVNTNDADFSVLAEEVMGNLNIED